ncbi:hypothetical protein ACF0H5_003920 [Mactra antiquata]
MILKLFVVMCGMILGHWLIDDFDSGLVKGKRVLVTGASTGIGEQLAYQYAEHGAHVVITARRENRLKEVIEECKTRGNKDQKFGYIVGDMLDIDSTENLIKNAVDKLGGLDVVVLNHILLNTLGFWEGSSHNFSSLERIMTVNFHSYVHLASHALPYVEKNNGSIVVVSSVAGKVGQMYVTGYSASKFALGGFFGGLRQELRMRNRDVSITLCTLGLIGTETAINALSNFGQDFILKAVGPASPRDTALAVMKGGALRVREVFYPESVYYQLLFRDWCPEILDYFIRWMTSMPE